MPVAPARRKKLFISEQFFVLSLRCTSLLILYSHEFIIILDKFCYINNRGIDHLANHRTRDPEVIT